MGVGDAPVLTDDELAGQLPWVVDQRSIRAVPRRRQPQAGLEVAPKEFVGRIEQDLGGRALEKAERLVGAAFGIDQDRDLDPVAIRVPGGALGLALADDEHVRAGITVAAEFRRQPRGSVHPARSNRSGARTG